MFPKFSLVGFVGAHRVSFLVVLSDEMDIPCFEDGCASDFAFSPMNFLDQKEWEPVKGYIVWNIENDKHEVVFSHQIKLMTGEDFNYSSAFDVGTSRLRNLLGLINLNPKYEGLSTYLKSHLKDAQIDSIR